jgi:cyclophilin family peptidyl-prolyl cis-trans isomerase
MTRIPTALRLGLIAMALSCLVSAQSAPTTRKSLREDPDNPVALIKTNHGDIYVELFAKEAPKTVGNFLGLASGRKEFTDTTAAKTEAKTEAKKVKRPFYDGLTFHRVIKGFMIQGGCPLGNGRGGPGYKFEDEINATALGLDKIKAYSEPPKDAKPDGKRRGGPHPWLLIRTRGEFDRMLLMPIVRELGIKNGKEFEARFKEVKAKLLALTLKEALENQGYRYDDKLGSHKPVRGSIAMANSGPDSNGSQFFINLVDTPHLTGKHTVFGKVIEGMDVVDKIGAVKVGPGATPVKPVTIQSIREIDHAAVGDHRRGR